MDITRRGGFSFYDGAYRDANGVPIPDEYLTQADLAERERIAPRMGIRRALAEQQLAEQQAQQPTPVEVPVDERLQNNLPI
jgi:hypothetical protein